MQDGDAATVSRPGAPRWRGGIEILAFTVAVASAPAAAIATLVPSGSPIEVLGPGSIWYPVPALAGILLEALVLVWARRERMVLALVGIGTALLVVLVWLLLWAVLTVALTNARWTM